MDVDAWLAELPAGTLDGWWEYYKLEPWGDDWERSSMIASQVLNTMMAMAPRPDGDELDPLPPDAFVPYRTHKSKEQRTLEETAAALTRLRAQHGSL